jgi:hypothetical protein
MVLTTTKRIINIIRDLGLEVKLVQQGARSEERGGGRKLKESRCLRVKEQGEMREEWKTGKMEYWNSGMLKTSREQGAGRKGPRVKASKSQRARRNAGRMENWNDGILE